MHCNAVILNGGKSSRMGGQSKDLLWLNDSTLINGQVNKLSKIFEDIIIVGKPIINSKIRNTFADIYKDSGPLAGIHSALSHTTSNYVFLFSCDMPFISTKLVKTMLDEIKDNNTQALVPIHQHGVEPLHAIYHKSALPIIEKLLSNNTFRIQSLFKYIDTKYFSIDKRFNPNEVFFNINKPEDLVKANKYAKDII